MRSYIRHPSAIPVHISTGSGGLSAGLSAYDLGAYDTARARLCNLSEGGVCFVTQEPVAVGDLVEVWVPSVVPGYQGQGVVVWRRDHGANESEVGVRFTSDDAYYRARMVEQVCLIEDYRHHLWLTGRQLSSEEAAQEWIAQFAAGFDHPDETEE